MCCLFLVDVAQQRTATAFPPRRAEAGIARPPSGDRFPVLTALLTAQIAWMKQGADGRLRAINPEYGFFGVAPGTSEETNPHALATCGSNTLFTNVGHTADGDVWWEGMTASAPENVRDWRRNSNWVPGDKDHPCAQGNSRFTTPLRQCPVLDPEWDSPDGVPIDAIVFGGRRDDTIPLVFESRSWTHGTFLGSVLRSNATGAADQKGTPNDPMAMKAFCGYNIKDYFQHWLDMGQRPGIIMPKVFQVNWFNLDQTGGVQAPTAGCQGLPRALATA